MAEYQDIVLVFDKVHPFIRVKQSGTAEVYLSSLELETGGFFMLEFLS